MYLSNHSLYFPVLYLQALAKIYLPKTVWPFFVVLWGIQLCEVKVMIWI